MTFSKAEHYTFRQGVVERKFVDRYVERLKSQNITHKVTETTTTISLDVWYELSVSDESVMKDGDY